MSNLSTECPSARNSSASSKLTRGAPIWRAQRMCMMTRIFRDRDISLNRSSPAEQNPMFRHRRHPLVQSILIARRDDVPILAVADELFHSGVPRDDDRHAARKRLGGGVGPPI